MAAPTPSAKPTPAEVRLAEQYVRVLDFLSRVAQAVQGGDWYYLLDKVGQLNEAVDRLEDLAADTWRAIEAGKPGPRREVVGRIVVREGRHYRAVQLLHPAQPDAAQAAQAALAAIAGHVADRLARHQGRLEYQARVQELAEIVRLLPDPLRAEVEVHTVLGEVDR